MVNFKDKLASSTPLVPGACNGPSARDLGQGAGRWLLTLGASVAVFSLTVGAQWFVYVFVLRGTGIRLISPAVAAIATGFFVMKAQQLAEHRRINDLRRFQVIADANHHVRNALQVLLNLDYTNDERSAEILRDAVQRIEWVLTDVLPGLDERAREPASPPK